MNCRELMRATLRISGYCCSFAARNAQMAAEAVQRAFSTSGRVRYWVAFDLRNVDGSASKEGDPTRLA
jgi:hypothetical protein